MIKVKAVDSKEVQGVMEHMRHIPKLRQFITCKTSDVLLSLGTDPAIGKVYGVEVGERYQGAKTHKHFGDMHLFYPAEKQVITDLFEACDKVHKILSRLGLEFLLDAIIWEIVPHTGGKWAGKYIYKRKGEEVTCRIRLQLEHSPASEYVYLLLHEIAHHMHFMFATGKKLNAKWVQLFNTSIKPQTIKKEVSQSLLENLIAGEDLPSDYRRLIPEEDTLSYKWILRTISQVHGITVQELDILFEAGYKDDIRALWPTRTISHKELEPVISEYSCVNWRETFAEAFSLHYGRKKNDAALPDPVIKLLERSISYAKTQQEKS